MLCVHFVHGEKYRCIKHYISSFETTIVWRETDAPYLGSTHQEETKRTNMSSTCKICISGGLSDLELYDHVGSLKIFSCGAAENCRFSDASQKEVFAHCLANSHDVTKMIDVHANRMKQEMEQIQRLR
jgi:hypothetical protein